MNIIIVVKLFKSINYSSDHISRRIRMYCYKCGAKNPDSAVYCMSCGTKILINSQVSEMVKASNPLKSDNANTTQVEKLRKIIPEKKPSYSHRVEHALYAYKLNVDFASEYAARNGRTSIAFYSVHDDNSSNAISWVEELPLYEGTPKQRSDAGKKAIKNMDYKQLHRPPIPLDNRGEAEQAAEILRKEIRKKGFTHFCVEIKEFHPIEKKKKSSFFSHDEITIINEKPKLIYCLRVSLTW